MQSPPRTACDCIIYYLDYHVLQVIESMVEVIREVPGISRVMYDLSSKPPGTTEWE